MTTLRARTVFADNRFTVTVIESMELQTGTTSPGRYATGSLEPVAIIVQEPGRKYAFDMDGEPADIDRLALEPGDLQPI